MQHVWVRSLFPPGPPVPSSGTDSLPSAHSPNASGRWHLLVDHLHGTAARAADFGQVFGGPAAALVGLLHDVGKADPAWQAYLRLSHDGQHPAPPDHKTAGAFLLHDLELTLLSITIRGHHGGLPAFDSFRGLLSAGPDPGQRAALQWAMESELLDGRSLDRATLIPAWALERDAAGKRCRELWLRMLFSALIDADRLDTEAHFDPERVEARSVAPATPTVLEQRFARSLRATIAVRAADPVAAIRTRIFQEVVGRAEAPRGWFTLTAPTGAGKTIAGLGFALRHANHHGLRRIVMAVPFVSVTEQVASVYRSLLDADDRVPGENTTVVEHHSGASCDTSESQHGAGLWNRLATENWDAEVIVTTTVQLLESLFDNRPSKVRKLHNLADAVIVIDEAQSVPWRLVEPTVDVLRELVDHYGCSVVLSTATQPPLHELAPLADTTLTELAGTGWASQLRRVESQFVNERLAWEEIADLSASEAAAHAGQCLVVLNTIADARTLARSLHGTPGLSHLSTRLCMAHRADVLRDVNTRLSADEPCVLVATQLVEAGIDLDFPVALRALGPLPAVAQVAGRVNRHGLRAMGRLVLVDPREGRTPPDEYAIGTQITRDLLRQGADPLEPSTLDRYWSRFVDACASTVDKYDIQRRREFLDFPTVADRYQLITDNTTPVLVPYADFRPDTLAIPDDPARRRSLLRRLQPYLVHLRQHELDRARGAGQILELGAGWLIGWRGPYDPFLGLQSDSSTEAMIW